MLCLFLSAGEGCEDRKAGVDSRSPARADVVGLKAEIVAGGFIDVRYNVPSSAPEVRFEWRGNWIHRWPGYRWTGRGAGLYAYQAHDGFLKCTFWLDGRFFMESRRTTAGSVRCVIPDKVRA